MEALWESSNIERLIASWEPQNPYVLKAIRSGLGCAVERVLHRSDETLRHVGHPKSDVVASLTVEFASTIVDTAVETFKQGLERGVVKKSSDPRTALFGYTKWTASNIPTSDVRVAISSVLFDEERMPWSHNDQRRPSPEQLIDARRIIERIGAERIRMLTMDSKEREQYANGKGISASTLSKRIYRMKRSLQNKFGLKGL